MSYYHRGDFLSDLGSGISKISSFANFIPGVGSAVAGVGSLIGGGISAIGSLFGGGGPPPMTAEQFAGPFNILNQATAFLLKNKPPMTSPGPPIGQNMVFPETRPPVDFYAATPETDLDYFEEEDYG